MQSIEEKKHKNDVIRRTCVITNLLYLFIHLMYLTLFIITKVKPLIYINIVSIVLYSLAFILIRKERYGDYAIGCGAEICFYVGAATVILGLEGGFFLWLFGLCVIAFFSGYFSRKRSSLHRPLRWCISMASECVLLVIYCRIKSPIYVVDNWLNTYLIIFHLVIVFGLAIAYLYVFAIYALNLEEKIRSESNIDRLTRIYNRHSLYTYFNLLEDKERYVLAIFDIDNFKKVNDTYGHICGDYILKELARLAKGYFKDDFVSRYGGEEFVIIFKDKDNNYEEAVKRIDDFRKSIAAFDFIFENRRIPCSITIGVNKYLDNYTIDEWVMHADNKLYEGKNSGKNITIS